MCDEINWNAIAAVGQCLGAIATFWAVWITLASVRHKVKIKIENGNYESAPGVFFHFFTITNGGPPITIEEVGMILPNKKQIFLTKWLESDARTLKYSHSLCCKIPYVQFDEILTENKLSKPVSVKIFFRDSLGKNYEIKKKFN